MSLLSPLDTKEIGCRRSVPRGVLYRAYDRFLSFEREKDNEKRRTKKEEKKITKTKK